MSRMTQKINLLVPSVNIPSLPSGHAAIYKAFRRRQVSVLIFLNSS